MNRRSLLGLLFAAPISAPAAIKAAMTEQPYIVGDVIARTIYSPSLLYGAADLGNVTAGLISNADGSFVIDCARNVISFEGDDITTDADADNGYWDEMHEIYDEDAFEDCEEAAAWSR